MFSVAMDLILVRGCRSCEGRSENPFAKMEAPWHPTGADEMNVVHGELAIGGTFVEESAASKAKRETEMSGRTWLQILMIIVPIGVLTASLGAGSIGNTVELSNRSVRVEIPESAELFAAGTMLVGIAGSAQRVMRRKCGTA